MLRDLGSLTMWISLDLVDGERTMIGRTGSSIGDVLVIIPAVIIMPRARASGFMGDVKLS